MPTRVILSYSLRYSRLQVPCCSVATLDLLPLCKLPPTPTRISPSDSLAFSIRLPRVILSRPHNMPFGRDIPRRPSDFPRKYSDLAPQRKPKRGRNHKTRCRMPLSRPNAGWRKKRTEPDLPFPRGHRERCAICEATTNLPKAWKTKVNSIQFFGKQRGADTLNEDC